MPVRSGNYDRSEGGQTGLLGDGQAIAHPFSQVSPSLELETKFVDLCRQVLGTNISATDNFLSAGGNLLLAMRLVLEVEKQLGNKLSLETIYKVQTIREIFCSLHREDQNKHIAVLPLKSGSGRKTLYYIHSAFEFSGLDGALLDDVATALVMVSDLHWARQLIDRDGIIGAIGEISGSYAQAIYENEDGKPSYLAGHSFGGVFAIETALKLEKLGAAPHAVFLFDTHLHGAMRRMFHNALQNGWLADKIAQALKGGTRGLSGRVRNIFRSSQKEFSSRIGSEERPDAEWSSVFDELREKGSRLYKGPQPPLRSRIVLFQATHSRSGRALTQDENLGWATGLKPNLTVVATPGDHFSLLTGTNADFIANEIERQIGLRE